MAAVGIPFVGPQAPEGRQAAPWPTELPKTSGNVPTYHTNFKTPETAERQLDFVFASNSLADSVKVKALNEPDEWGPTLPSAPSTHPALDQDRAGQFAGVGGVVKLGMLPNLTL